jgi:uncharacterized protein YcfJ
MVTQYDDKGKIFTQVLSKHPVPVVIQTPNQMIRGNLHVKNNCRVKDELNGDERFIAVTEAVVYNQLNEEIFRTGFLVVNADHILWLIPDEESASIR